MILQKSLGPNNMSQLRALSVLINRGEVVYAGNAKLKIYGLLSCRSGMRMKVENRVFFENEEDALTHGYRPCGHCLRKAYLRWKSQTNVRQI